MHPNYESYFDFMKYQVNELLTQYGPIGGLWLDGYWDHDQDTVPFDWRMQELYRYAHSLQPALLIGNNHHIDPLEGEDFQMFERDLPGENTAGLSGQEISRLPLEMCQTMNGMWGYKVSDTNYKTTDELIVLLVRAAAKGSNLLLNVGPQPNGALPAVALDRLRGIGQWLKTHGFAIYGTRKGSVAEADWGVSTMRGDSLFLHVIARDVQTLSIPLPKQPRSVSVSSRFDKKTHVLTLTLPKHEDEVDYVVTIQK